VRHDYDPHARDCQQQRYRGRQAGNYFWSAGHSTVRTDPVLAPSANQLRGRLGYGNENRRGWNYGFDIFFDYRKSALSTGRRK